MSRLFWLDGSRRLTESTYGQALTKLAIKPVVLRFLQALPQATCALRRLFHSRKIGRAYPDRRPAPSMAIGGRFLRRGLSGGRNSLSLHTVDSVVVGGEPSVISEESLLTFKGRVGPRVVGEGLAAIGGAR